MGHQAYEGGGGGAEWLSPLINTADLCGEAFPFNKHTELMSRTSYSFSFHFSNLAVCITLATLGICSRQPEKWNVTVWIHAWKWLINDMSMVHYMWIGPNWTEVLTGFNTTELIAQTVYCKSRACHGSCHVQKYVGTGRTYMSFLLVM